MAKSLFEQMSETGRGAVAVLVGANENDAGFACYMREVPPLAEGFTIGDAARAYLQTRLAALEADKEIDPLPPADKPAE